MSAKTVSFIIEERDFYSFTDGIKLLIPIFSITSLILYFQLSLDIFESIFGGVTVGVLLAFFNQPAMLSTKQRRFIVVTSEAVKVSSEGFLQSGPITQYLHAEIDPDSVRLRSIKKGKEHIVSFRTAHKNKSLRFSKSNDAKACVGAIKAAILESNKPGLGTRSSPQP